MKALDLTPILNEHQGKWVALSDDSQTVYGAGDTAKAALADAQSKGHANCTLLYVQPFDAFLHW